MATRFLLTSHFPLPSGDLCSATPFISDSSQVAEEGSKESHKVDLMETLTAPVGMGLLQ